MAWIRWRGQTAQLMATVWDHGKSRHQYLGSLGAVYTVPEWVRTNIAARFPTLSVDWEAVNRALAAGPPGDKAPSPAAWDWAQVEWLLEEWSRTGPAIYPDERPTLRLAAHVLREWRAREHHNAQATDSERAGEAPAPPTGVT